ncbi:beta' subunit [Coelomomyces lativittatus]|nr:beta' subunit [Coelomomyces lativittatus]
MGLLKDYKIKTPLGYVSSSPSEALMVSEKINSKEVVIKAQVLAGGRGKGKFTSGLQGGVKLCTSHKEVEKYAKEMLGYRLITKQTGAEGKPCNKVYICERLFPKHEFYFAVLMDRKHQGPVLVGSSQGGMDIEAVAAKDPTAIHTLPIDIKEGLSLEAATNFAKKIGFKENASEAATVFTKLYRLFLEKDATLIEINPMAVEKQSNSVVCMDCKINIDDNADFRQTELFKLRDLSQEDPREVKAAEAKLNYIGLDGNIGCLVNGAGLAMATMDIITLKGGKPANFLDVGGSATPQQVTDAFRIISSDSRVTSIFVNIFGGIMQCDVIARGVVDAYKALNLKTPVTVRLQGTHAEEARKILAESKLRLISKDDLDEAAEAAVSFSD